MALALAACASAREKGDRAYDREDWDRAVLYYEKALDRDEPEHAAHVKERLAASRRNAAEAHDERARALAAAGDLEAAHDEAQAALDFTSDAEVARFAGDVQRRYGAELLEACRGAVAGRDWPRAVELLERARELAPGTEVEALLAVARNELDEQQAEDFEDAWERARAAMARQNWAAAARHLDEAHEFGATPRSESAREFVVDMHAAESAVTEGRPEAALEHFRNALEHGFQRKHVEQRIRQMSPQRYRITVESAAILPFKPRNRKPWDGPGAAFPHTDRTLADLASVERGRAMVEGFAQESRRFAGPSDPPDCFVVIEHGADRIESAPADDTFHPVWHAAFDVRATSLDRRMVRLEVHDRDALAHDLVGRWQIPVGDLVRRPGTNEFGLLTPEAQLRAGGLLAIRIVVEPLD